MKKTLRCLTYLVALSSLYGCGDDAAHLPEALAARADTERLSDQLADDPTLRNLAEEGRRAAPVMSRDLTEADIDLWCEVERAAREAKGDRDALSAATEMQAARRAVCRKRDVGLLEYQVINARLTVALMHIDRDIPVDPDKKADTELVRRLRDKIRAARGR